MPDAVVLDLFGTVVAAPTSEDRSRAAARLGVAAGCDGMQVERYLRTTWRVRHDGSLPTLRQLAEHFLDGVGGSAARIPPVVDQLRRLGEERLGVDPSVIVALAALRDGGLRLGVLSDASADIAAAWRLGPLSLLVDAAVFSCSAGALKPDRGLYDRIRRQLGTSSGATLYVGDGGGDELRGALAAGMRALAVVRRGPADALVFGEVQWSGSTIERLEDLPAYLSRPPASDRSR